MKIAQQLNIHEWRKQWNRASWYGKCLSLGVQLGIVGKNNSTTIIFSLWSGETVQPTLLGKIMAWARFRKVVPYSIPKECLAILGRSDMNGGWAVVEFVPPIIIEAGKVYHLVLEMEKEKAMQK